MALLLGVLGAAGQSAVVTSDPVAGWVDARATAEVRGVVVTEARQRQSSTARAWQQSASLEIRVATSRMSARGSAVAVEVPVLVSLPVEAEVPPPGTWVELVGRLGAATWQSDAAARLSVRTITVIGEPGVVDTVAHAMRLGLRSALADAPVDAGSLVAGLSVGDEWGQPRELADDMRSTGLSHLTAVSGGNVAIVLAAVLGLALLLRTPLVARVLLSLAALGYFAVLVGPQPSVLRACAMGAIATAGLLSGGRRAGPSVLGTGVLVLVITAPWLATSWAFALSVLATAGLILLAGRLVDLFGAWRLTRRWPLAVRQGLALTTAAQLATLPVLVAMGASVGWVALPANLVVMPVVAPITVLGLFSAAVSPLAPALAALVAQWAAWPAAWIALVAHAGAGLPLAQLPWPTGWWGLAAVSACGLALLLAGVALRRWGLPAWTRGRGVRAAGATAVAAGLLMLLWAPPDRQGWPPPGWFLIMCDVGQGDALVLRAGEGMAVVVDAGPDPDAVDRCLADARVTRVPAVVLTHFHADHVGGLEGILRGRSVGVVASGPVREPLDGAEGVDRQLRETGVASATISAGDARSVGDVSWRAIWPRRRIAAGDVPNNASIVLVATIAGHRVLLTGDVEPEAQAAVAADLGGAGFDVVKVPHHGSRHQAAELPAWAPGAVALVSVGTGNDYGHPDPGTLAAWAESGALVARTDRDGDVAVVGTGSGVGVVVRRGMLPSS